MFEGIKNWFASFNWEKIIRNTFSVCRWFNIKLTTAFGITTTVHWSVVAFALASLLFGGPMYCGIMLLVFLCVVPHEYGHALAARMFGIKTRSIVLYPLGGVALLEPNPEVQMIRMKEFVVAIAGPIVTLILSMMGLGAMLLGSFFAEDFEVALRSYQGGFWFYMFAINMSLFIFNMIPAFPMDGGRVLRSILSCFMDHALSTRIAFYVSIGFCAMFAILGLVTGNFMLLIIAAFIYMVGKQEVQHAAMMGQMQAQIEAQKKLGKN
jgi:Zn-dependent protease